MCGRYYRRSDKQRIGDAFNISDLPSSLIMSEDYNVTPTTFQPVIRNDKETGERELVLMRWGLVPLLYQTTLRCEGHFDDQCPCRGDRKESNLAHAFPEATLPCARGQIHGREKRSEQSRVKLNLNLRTPQGMQREALGIRCENMGRMVLTRPTMHSTTSLAPKGRGRM